MKLPSPEVAHSTAVSLASAARIAASVMGGGITEATNARLGLALAQSNAGRFRDAHTTIDGLADEQKAWIPCMLVLRAAQATFGNESGPPGELAPCPVCEANLPPVFTGARICLGCVGAPPTTTVARAKQA